MTDADLALRDEVAEVLHPIVCGWDGEHVVEKCDETADALLPLLACVREKAASEALADAEAVNSLADKYDQNQLGYERGLAEGEARARERIARAIEAAPGAPIQGRFMDVARAAHIARSAELVEPSGEGE